MELPQNLWQTFACVASKKNFPQEMKLPQNLLQTFACIGSENHFPQNMELPQNLLQTFACVLRSIINTLSSKYGVTTKFMANFCLCSIKKNFPRKMELPQNLLHTFTCSIRKKKFLKKWSCHKNYCKLLLAISEKKLSTKNGVATNFIATFYL